MLIAGLPYSAPELGDISELRGGSPYGAATVAGSDGSRKPSAKELALAKFQGEHVAKLVSRMQCGESVGRFQSLSSRRAAWRGPSGQLRCPSRMNSPPQKCSHQQSDFRCRPGAGGIQPPAAACLTRPA
jgi:hypothetical protein